MFSQMCSTCQEERRRALAGEEETSEDDWPPSAHPGCFFEWVIGPTEKVEAAEGLDQLMGACGWEAVYRRENTPEENARLRAEFEEKRSRDE